MIYRKKLTHSSREGSKQPAHVLRDFKQCYPFILIALLILNLSFVIHYGLSRKRMAESRGEPRARRGVI